MFRGNNGQVEIAMTHRPGAGGMAERVMRPDAVREAAERVQRWAVTAEACKSCISLPAVRLMDGLGLCGRCHTQRAERIGVRFDPAGLRPVTTRAEGVEPNEKRLEGYAIRFNEKSYEIFGFFEIIRPAAADRMVSEKPDLRYLWNHDSSEPLGRTTAGTLRAEKRTVGVWAEVEPPRWASKHVETVERRDVSGQSFGFITLTDDWWLEDGVPHREILDMYVIEFSAVSFPAYPSTTLRVAKTSDRSSMWMAQETAERLRLAQ